MTTSRIFKKICSGAGIGGIVCGAYGVMGGALSGLTGAAIMGASGNSEYDILEAAKAGALGAALLNFVLGAAGGARAAVLSTDINISKYLNSKKSWLGTGVGYIALMTAGSAIGAEILLAAGNHMMTLQQDVISGAVGAVVSSIPVICILNCCITLCIGGCIINVLADAEGQAIVDEVTRQIDQAKDQAIETAVEKNLPKLLENVADIDDRVQIPEEIISEIKITMN